MLSKEQISEIKELKDVCEKKEGYELKLNFDMLENRNEDNKEDFFHYEDGKLVGFLGSYYFGRKVEYCGMIHPNYRRKGIFTNLLNQGLEEARKRGAQNILFNAPAASQSGKDFLVSIPCTYAFSEHQMKWHQTELMEDTTISLRAYDYARDKEIEIQLDVLGFGMAEEDAREYVEILKEQNDNQRMIIEIDGKAVGKIRVSELDGEAWIYGFVIFPELRGQGIGRRALTKVVKMEEAKGLPIFLEVEAKNARALKLYESCGFKSYHSQDYYEFNM
ncbi:MULTISPECIES: GNAT family N-acetyltransferase [Niallia]|uniref:GNAT family N-acetyltransferase n=1 Tax=Niallia alba TaxID=2729105 RepID=A0A7Y0PLI2_9BACI|nr:MULTISPECIES: GNAT family N-acetyltransferase [Niallia]EOR23937.1 GNAT family acetyltransferase [Niallia nealsonii AAU1]MBQ6448817.1 GNAT family N-acetyltransferase [Bacillus sp. (in: firmicutes)]NMO76366.1 GNAT family N-acetyltransferase [Niallia alba]UTI44082.1 GNAT family N-acetyltransferase [Niallia sp. RD1]